jgi:hypothetical protein
MPTTIEMMIHCDNEMRRKNDLGRAPALFPESTCVLAAVTMRFLAQSIDAEASSAYSRT